MAMAHPVAMVRRCHSAVGHFTAIAALQRAAQQTRVAAGVSAGSQRLQLGQPVLVCHALSTSAVTLPAAAATSRNDSTPHVPVLLDEVLSFFDGRRLETYVDGTLGAGGHASALLRAHPEMRTLVGFDLDTTAHALGASSLAAAGARVVYVGHAGRSSGDSNCRDCSSDTAAAAAASHPTALIVHSNFGAMRRVLEGGLTCSSLVGRVDGMLLDLGISSMQVDTSERGFSFQRDGPLDMRMDPEAALSAEALVNTWSEEDIGRVIKEFGEERHWRLIARRIVAARMLAPITTTQQLVQAIGSPGGSAWRGGGGRRGGGDEVRSKHPATRTFQAIRIAVNGELASVASVLPDAINALCPGGRLAVITFHSLEDRIVKWAFRRAAGMAASDAGPPPDYMMVGGAGDFSLGTGAKSRSKNAASLQQRAAAAHAAALAAAGDEQPASIRILTRRPVGPTADEEQTNPRSRSAKLRVVEKLPPA